MIIKKIPTLPTLCSGRYTLTPFASFNAATGFSARLAIRNGRGSASHSRLLTYTPRFKTEAGALNYARAQASSWLADNSNSRRI